MQNKNFDVKLVIGVLISFVVGGLTYFINGDAKESLIVGMFTSIFSILISIKLDIDHSKSSILNSIKTAKDINSDIVINELISSIVNNYKKIKNINNEYLISESIDSLKKCTITLSDLSGKKINTEAEDKRMMILLNILKNTKNQIYAVSYPSSWKESLINRVFQENKKMIEKGVNIKRIFVLKKVDADIIEMFKFHLSIGVECYVAFEEYIPSEVRKHQVIYDDLAVTIPLYEKNGYMNGGTISFDEKDIHKAKDTWKRLELFSKRIVKVEELEGLNNLTS